MTTARDRSKNVNITTGKARLRWWCIPAVAAYSCIGAACGSIDGAGAPIDEEQDIGTAVSDLDSVCTADPTDGLKTAEPFNARYMSTAMPTGVEVTNITALGPTCGYGSNRNDNCCAANAGTVPYIACKDVQRANATLFIQAFTPQAPLIPPVDMNPPAGSPLKKIIVIQGDYYTWTTTTAGGIESDPHATAVDMRKESIAAGENPSFPVYAAGDGEVVYADWFGQTAGNIVVLRHPMSDGSWYLTEYRHVRGGRSRDQQKFCSCINPAGATSAIRLAGCTTTQKATKECKYTANPANDWLWGTDADSLPALNTVFRLGQQVVTAGNTGTVTLALEANNDGTLDDVNGNTHLHFGLSVPTGGNEQDPNVPDQVTLDVFGVYSKANGVKNGKACYAYDNVGTFPRLVNEFDPNVYVDMRNDPGLLCRPTGSGALTYSSSGAAVNATALSENVVCTAGRFGPSGNLSNYVFGRVWVNDQSTTGDVCCHISTKNPSGNLRSVPDVCSSGTGAQSLALDYPKMYDPFSYSQYDISCTLPASSGGASSSIQSYRVQQQHI
jgi:hypothetical protein